MENDTAWPWAFGTTARAVLFSMEGLNWASIGLYTADDWMTPETLEFKDAVGIGNILISSGRDAACVILYHDILHDIIQVA